MLLLLGSDLTVVAELPKQVAEPGIIPFKSDNPRRAGILHEFRESGLGSEENHNSPSRMGWRYCRGYCSSSASTAQLVAAKEMNCDLPPGSPLSKNRCSGLLRVSTIHEPSSFCVFNR